MMAEHGDPCTGSEVSYCMNGGKCFKIPSVSTPTCVCGENYKGSRCEQFQLLIVSNNSEEKGMIAAVIIILILILVMLAVIIYYICKMKRKAGQNERKQPQNGQEYWKVKSRGASDLPRPALNVI
ncbi:pro-neuregulin-4, membrane-bound isoform [Pygocentrus nattereri]|uniref:EGF-like domain-containing protein n=1 Tax=Pygocentrus nattereri TaxID=42514 RepID=A0A3B4DZS1_PYGNA|nr:pro-neuregulin-4, membrane-bound isoform [Pygocentrus nattereri]XP_037398885.1 pro-neuregulin-4, membrane-bound isoform [Pygocentrus nattereri]